MTTQDTEIKSDKKGLNKGWGAFFILVGLVLLVGSVSTIINKEWPIFLTPMQLDGVYAIFKVFGEKAAIYLGTFLLFIAGLGSCWLGVNVLKHENDA